MKTKKTTKTKILWLVTIGVLVQDLNTKWAAPTFIKPNKTANVRVLTNLNA